MTKTSNFRSALAAMLLTCCLQSAFAQTFWTETFSDQTTSTTNWVHGGTNTGIVTWAWTDVLNAGAWTPGNFTSPTGSTGYMWFDSDGNGDPNTHDVTLTGTGVPANCTGKFNVHLKFYTYFRTFSGADLARVGVSTDGTNFTYINVPQFDNLPPEGASASVYQGYIDIPLPQANNQAQVWIQFRYAGTFEYYWKVDDLELYIPPGPVPCDQNPMAIICDKLDTYVTTMKLGPQATWWTTWSGTEGTTEDGIVSIEQANSAPNSLKIISTAAAGGPQDVVLNLGNKSTGNYELKFKVYVPAGKNGYYNMQQIVPVAAGDWNFNVFFNNAGAGQFTDGANVELATFTYPYGQWFECKHTFDLDNNLQTFWVNGVFVKKAAYLRNVGGIDFYGTNNISTFYVDDIEYIGLPPVVFNVDNCGGAVDLSLYLGQAPTVPQTTGLYNNTTATVAVTDPAAPTCFADGFPTPVVPKLDGTMWYTFTGDGETYHIETVPCTADTNYIDNGDTQMAIYTGDCGSLSQTLCNEDLAGASDFRAGLDIETVAGTNYRMLIDGWSDALGVVAQGQFCIEITRQASITCAEGAVGTFTIGNNGFLCDLELTGSLFTLNEASFVIPTIGPVYGLAWAISIDTFPAGIWPPFATADYWGSFGVNTTTYIPNTANDGAPFTQNAVWYFTPVVVAGAVDTVPATAGTFLHELDISNACFFVGQTLPIIMLDELAPLDATFDVTQPTTPPGNNGAIALTVTGGFFDLIQDPIAYLVEWSGPNGFTSQDEDLIGLAAGDYSVTITDITGCVDPYEFTVSVLTSANDPASVKSLGISPNPTANVATLNLSLANAAEVRVEVLSTLGQMLQTVNAGNVSSLNQQIDLSRFADGTYFVRVTIDGETALRRLVLQR